MNLLNVLFNFCAENLGLVGIVVMATFYCLNFSRNQKKQLKAEEKLRKAIKVGANEPPTLHPVIDPSKCAGCGACTRVCPEGDILQMINGKAVLVAPSKCVGHGECEKACPFGAIDLVFGTKTRGVEIPRVSGNYETNVPGLYIAGELGGMGLIRNAIRQGEAAAKHAIENIQSTDRTDYDILIVGAGPAGLSATLMADLAKVSYTCIEQSTLGGTVYNFPRQKVVMSQPAKLPGIGEMRFSRNKVSKEELLRYWQKVRDKRNLSIVENVKFESLETAGQIFKVKTSVGQITAKKVLLCMGVRGSPRRLGLKNEDTEKVAYNLLEPEQYQGKHVVVVGGGNAGVEAAQRLSDPKYKNKVHLLVRGPGFDRCNEENKNIIEAMEKKGLLQIWFESFVKEIEKSKIVVTRKTGDIEIPNDFLFVFAGAEMPFKFLMSIGIEIDKAFGDKKVRASL